MIPLAKAEKGYQKNGIAVANPINMRYTQPPLDKDELGKGDGDSPGGCPIRIGDCYITGDRIDAISTAIPGQSLIG
jgi:hypothetical protein